MIDSNALPWSPVFPGFESKPLRFFADLSGYVGLLRLEPGTVIPRHRHTGDVHAYNLSGSRKLDTGEVIAAGGYVYEPVGNVDSWMAIGDEPVIVHVVVRGNVEYLDDDGNVIRSATPAMAYERYRNFCAERGVVWSAAAEPPLSMPKQSFGGQTTKERFDRFMHYTAEVMVWSAAAVPPLSLPKQSFGGAEAGASAVDSGGMAAALQTTAI